jgi:hypothetical protein
MRNIIGKLVCALLGSALFLAIPVAAQIEDVEEQMLIEEAGNQASVAFRIPDNYSTRVRTTLTSVTAESNSQVNAAVDTGMETEGSFNNARRQVRVYRVSTRNRGRQELSEIATVEANLPREVDPMPFADGTQCERVSLRYRFKKNKFFVYPPLASDVGESVAQRKAGVACQCGKQIRPNLPCYNGTIKRKTKQMVLIMP